MSSNEVTNWLLIAVIIIVAVSRGVSATIDYLASKSPKPLPKSVMTVKEVADFLVAEAATLDLTGAEKKEYATKQLMEAKPNLTRAVAKGAIQNSYNNSKNVGDVVDDSDDEAKQIGFTTSDDDHDE